MPTFWDDIKRSFWITIFATFAVAGTVATLWSVYVPADTKIDHRWVLTLLVVCIVAVGVLVEVARQGRYRATVAEIARTDAVIERDAAETRARAAEAEPRVVSAIDLDAETLLLVSPAKSFGRDAVAVIYQRDREFELEIGLGRVTLVQHGADRAQIQVVDKQGKADLWGRINQGDTILLQSLTVRPGIPFHLYQKQDSA